MKRAIILAACLIALPALAQNGEPGNVKGHKITLSRSAPGSDDAAGSLGAALEQALSAPYKAIADLINSDLDGAITLSTKIPALQDGNGQQCWMAMKQFGDVVKAHPLPLTGHAATDLEAARLMAMSANKLCADPHCTQVFADLASAVQTAAPVNVSIPIPSLHDLCSKVPQVGVAPIAPPSSATPAPVAPANP